MSLLMFILSMRYYEIASNTPENKIIGGYLPWTTKLSRSEKLCCGRTGEVWRGSDHSVLHCRVLISEGVAVSSIKSVAHTDPKS